MRRALDQFYGFCGVLASAFIALICAIVLIQVFFNLIDKVAEFLFGSAIGLVLPSYAEFAGYFLVASMSFALADTLKHKAHIRVVLLTQKMSVKQLWLSELLACLVGAALTVFFAFWAFNLVFESYQYKDLSPGIIPVPLWIPQLSLALGVAALAVCFVDELISTFLAGSGPNGSGAASDSDLKTDVSER